MIDYLTLGTLSYGVCYVLKLICLLLPLADRRTWDY